METIKNVIYYTNNNELEIHHIDGFLRIENTENNNYKGIKIYNSKTDEASFMLYDLYSKAELISFQYVLLKAYVFLHDQLDNAITNSESKLQLDEIKNKVIISRKHLKYITNYIDSYPEILNEYKDI